MRFPFTLPEGQQFTQAGRRLVALSPDGAHMVYAASSRLHLRAMAELESKPIGGTESTAVTNPIFSPDGQFVAFWDGAGTTGSLKKIFAEVSAGFVNRATFSPDGR